jgi:hypothetical protein
MGPVAIAGGGRVNDGGALLVIHPLERSERRVGEEKAVELQRRPFARTGEGEFAVQVGVVRIADGRNRRKAVHSAAQDDDDEPRIAGVRRARRRAEEARAAKDAGRRRARALDEAAAGEGEVRSLASHGHLLWNSSAMNRSASACSRDSARSTA